MPSLDATGTMRTAGVTRPGGTSASAVEDDARCPTIESARTHGADVWPDREAVPSAASMPGCAPHGTVSVPASSRAARSGSVTESTP